MDEPDIVTLSTRLVYENRWTRMREDRIRRRDGSVGLYGVVEKSDFVVVAPIDRGVVHLVQQYRYPVRSRQWEFPQGSCDGPLDISVLEVGRRELSEETGLIAGDLVEVGRLYPLYGVTNHQFTVLLATSMTAGRQQLDAEEQDLITRAFSLAEFERMILEGIVLDAGTIAAFGLLRLKGLA